VAEHDKAKEKEKKPEPKAEEPKSKDEAAEGKSDLAHKGPDLNPLHWFHHEKDKADAGATPTTAPTKEEGKSLTAHSASARPHREAPEPQAEPEPARPKGPTVVDYEKIWDRKDRSEILAGNLQRLEELQQHAHSLYKHLITEYAAEVHKLIDGKTRGVSNHLGQLQAERRRIHERARALESYVDWYEASENNQWSGLFDDYLHLQQKLSEEAPKQSDEISKYLDAVEKEYES